MAIQIYAIRENIVKVAAGVATASIILGIFQFASPHAFDGLEKNEPFAYYTLTESYKPVQVRNELLGMITGIFCGVLLVTFLFPGSRKITAVLVPVLLLFILSFSFWPFIIQKELLWLGLPVWAGISLAALYTGRLIRQKIKGADQAQKTA